MVTGVVSAVIDQLAEELGRSVVVNDPAVQMLYASTHYGDDDPVRVRALLNHGAEPGARGHVLAQGVSSWTRAGMIPANDEIGMHARVCVPVRFEGELLGLLMVMDADGSITTAELGRVNTVASELAFALHGDDRRATGDADESTVLDLVGGEAAARRDAVARLRDTGRAARFAIVTAVEIALAGTASTTHAHVEIALRHALTVHSRNARGDALFAIGPVDRAVLLIGGEHGRPAIEQRAADVLERVHEFAAGRFRCVAGVGSTGDGVDHAAQSSTQAQLACRAAALGLQGSVASWQSLGAYGPLLSVPADQLTEAALPDEVQRLRAVDPDGQLVATLRAYLDAAGNGPAAAQQLHIHRTSLYYRLGRIRDLTGIDVADGRTRLAVHTGLAMLDVIRARRP